MSKIEKREFKKIKQAKKDLKKIKSKVATTLQWIDIDEIEDYYIKLKRNKKEEYIKGIKLYPHNIFLDEPNEQIRRLNKIRLCLNKIKSDMFLQHSQVNGQTFYSNPDLRNIDRENYIKVSSIIEKICESPKLLNEILKILKNM